MDQQITTLGDLAALVHCVLIGPSETPILGAAPLYEVQPDQITLLDDARIATKLVGKVAALVVKQPIDGCSLPQIVSSDPRATFAKIIEHFIGGSCSRVSDVGCTTPSGISATASVHPTATVSPSAIIEHGVTIGRDVVIGARTHLMPGVVVMEGVTVGDDATVFPNVTLYPRTEIGNRVTIHAGSVLGAYGFGYKSTSAGHERTPQLGYVVIEDEVEIGACVTIDRGTFGSTRIGFGTKIDNQVMIGHNCQIGKYNLLCSQVGIAGSCKTGDFVVLAGQVGLKDHITLGDHAVVGAQAGVMDDLPGGQVYLGSPATTQREQMQIMAVQRRLPELRRVVKQLEKASQPPSDKRAA